MKFVRSKTLGEIGAQCKAQGVRQNGPLGAPVLYFGVAPYVVGFRTKTGYFFGTHPKHGYFNSDRGTRGHKWLIALHLFFHVYEE